MIKPNFFIAGMPKSGTTALYEYLGTHPNIFLSTPKEPHFFAEDLPHRAIREFQDYLALFDNTTPDHLSVGEASVHYMYSDCALENIAHFNPAARIIVMLRNPVDMLYSFHAQNYFSMEDDIQSFEQAWHLQDQRSKGDAIPRTNQAAKLLQYREIGKLGSHVKKLFSHFPREQICIVFFEDFRSDTSDVYRSVLDFLGLPDDHRVDFPVVNSNKVYRSQAVQSVVLRLPDGVRHIGKAILGQYAGQLRLKLRDLNSVQVKRSPLSQEFRMELMEYFKDEIQLLDKLTGRDLSAWQDINGRP